MRILGTVLLRVSSGTISPTFIEIGSYLTDKEQKNKFAQFLRHGVQNCFLRFFYLRPLTPKIYSPKFCTKSPISRLVRQIDRRYLGLLGGFQGWPIQWKHAKCFGEDPCCHDNEIWARQRDPVAYRLVVFMASLQI